MLTALAFLLVNLTGWILSLRWGPIWALLVAANIYFNAPIKSINWWAAYLPIHRWSLLSAAIIVISLFIHRQRLAPHFLGSLKWAIAFLFLSGVLSWTIAVNPPDASGYTYTLFTFLVTAYCIIRGLKNVSEYRILLLGLILLATNLSIKAYLFGRRVHGRLEGIGTVDASGSNEFGLLLAAIIPLTLPFILHGKKHEKILCFAALPFLVNALILCNSRGAFVALVGGMGFVFVVINDIRLRKVMLVAVLVAIPLFIRLADEALIERISTILSPAQGTMDNGKLDVLSSGRTEIWYYSIEMLKDYPFGAGPNGFRHLARHYLPPGMLDYTDPRVPEGTRAAHNSYLQVLVEQGYIGLILWMGLCGHTIFLLIKAFYRLKNRSGSDPFLKDSITMLIVSYLSILAGSLLNSRIYYEFFWWQTAICMVSVSLTITDGGSLEVCPLPGGGEKNITLLAQGRGAQSARDN